MNDRLPPLNSLRAFEAAARHLSFTRASEELHVTQGAISQQITMLENFIGVKLFERRHREVRLTTSGASYFRAVQTALEIITRETMALRSKQEDSTLRIKALPTLAMRWLVPRLADFTAKHPKITVLVNTKNELADFEREDVDGAIEYGDGQWKNVEAELLFPVAVVPVCAPRLADGSPPPADLKDLEKHVLLHSLVRPQLWPEWLQAAGMAGTEMGKIMRFQTSGLAYQAALDGLGVALTEVAYIRDDISAGRLVMPFDLIVQQPLGYYWVYPREKRVLEKFAVFRRWLLQQAQDVPKSAPSRPERNVVALSTQRRR